MALSTNKSPFAGHSLEGLEHMFGNVVIAGENNDITSMYRPTRPFQKLPGRVICNVPLELRDMNLYVKKDVAAGDLLFKIERPLLNIVKNGKVSLASTCDNCFATFNEIAPGVKLSSIPNPEITFLACDGCKVYYYCNKACQKAAWKHHHKYECKTLSVLRESPVKNQEGVSVVYFHESRAMIRLLCLHKFNDDKNKLISKEEWSEILAIPTNQKYKTEQADLALVAEKYAELWEELIDPELHHNTIIGLICSLSQNSERIRIPFLKGAGRSFDSQIDSTVSNAGIVFEPVSALLKHSCEPNTWTVFEGKEMRLRALKDISAGTQLTRSFQKGYRGSYEDRQEFLKSQYGIDCKCEICQLGHMGPTGALQDRVNKYAYGELVNLASAVQRRTVDRAIADMQAAGFGYEAPQMRALHQYALKGNIHEFDTAKSTIQSSHDHMKACTPLPTEVQKLRLPILFHLKAKVHQETEKWFGADSVAAKTEKFIFEDLVVKVNAMAIPLGKSLGYVPLKDSAVERVKFVKAMNELLKWAGLPSLDAKDLV